MYRHRKLGGFTQIFPDEMYLVYLDNSRKVYHMKTVLKSVPLNNEIRSFSTGISAKSRRPLSPSFFDRLSKPVRRETRTIMYQGKKERYGVFSEDREVDLRENE